MRLVAFVILYLTILSPASPAQPALDSLEAQLATAADTARLRLYEQLYQATIHTQPEKAREYTERWIQLAQQLNNPTQQISALLGRGRYHYVQGNFARAIHQSERALVIAKSLNDTARIASLYNGIGYMIFNMGRYDEALEKLFVGLRLNEVLQDSLAMHKSKFNIANVYVMNNKPRRALDYFLVCANYFEQPALLAKCWLNLGATYPDVGQYDSSFYYYQQALTYYEGQDDAYHAAKVLNGLGQNMLDQREHQAALSYYQQSLQLNESVQNQSGMALDHRDLGKAYTQTGQFEKALDYLDQAVALSQDADAPQELMEHYVALAETYAAQGNHSRAYAYRLKYFDLYQEVYNQEKEQQMAELETVYQLDKKEQAIVLQNQEIALLAEQNTVVRYQRWGLIGGFGLLMALLAVWYNRQRLKAQKERALQEKDQRLTEEKLKSAKLTQHQLQQKLAFKNRELTTHALHLGQKTELLEEIKNRINAFAPVVSPGNRAEIKQLKQIIRGDQYIENDWQSFTQHFKQVHPDFSHRLQRMAGELTANEVRLAMMLRMNLSTKEIASITNISPEGVKKARYRLRKKLNLTTQENIQEFILQL